MLCIVCETIKNTKCDSQYINYPYKYSTFTRKETFQRVWTLCVVSTLSIESVKFTQHLLITQTPNVNVIHISLQHKSIIVAANIFVQCTVPVCNSFECIKKLAAKLFTKLMNSSNFFRNLQQWNKCVHVQCSAVLKWMVDVDNFSIARGNKHANQFKRNNRSINQFLVWTSYKFSSSCLVLNKKKMFKSRKNTFFFISSCLFLILWIKNPINSNF